MDYQVIIVGGGMAGLTAAAYLAQAGCKVLLCEKEAKIGGLVNSFEYKGFVFDGGIRAIENSGIVRPMLKQLGLEVPWLANEVSIGIGQDVVNLKSEDSLADYLQLLKDQFPESALDIEQFGREIKTIMRHMEVLYGIDNPLFMNLKEDRRYLTETLLPWLFKFPGTIRKINRLDKPVDGYLQNISKNQALIDMIAQHFFKQTPTFFALSYFSLYLDYQYPQGGTGRLSELMKQYILEHEGEIRCETEIVRLDPEQRLIEDQSGTIYHFEELIWTADLKRLYQVIDLDAITKPRVRQAVADRKAYLAEMTGNDSILTLYLTLDIDSGYFAKIANAHFFYTPDKAGLSSLDSAELMLPDGRGYSENKQAVFDWAKRYYQLTTFEISCPAMRDEKLAPAGQSGLIISTLFDYPLAKHIETMGWYDEFKAFSAQVILDVLNGSIYPGFKEAVMDSFVSTPLTLQKLTGNTDGAITGWSFTNSSVPVVNRMSKVAKSVLTPIPNVYQAGQWSYSPSGLPISIMTGKLAADQVRKKLK